MREAVLEEANDQGGNAELVDSRRLRLLDSFICINEAILHNFFFRNIIFAILETNKINLIQLNLLIQVKHVCKFFNLTVNKFYCTPNNLRIKYENKYFAYF